MVNTGFLVGELTELFDVLLMLSALQCCGKATRRVPRFGC